jgi:hypothetical protein
VTVDQKVMPDDHSKLVPLLPIPNRTVKRLSADDSADSRVKVGHRQALTARSAQLIQSTGRFLLGEKKCVAAHALVSGAAQTIQQVSDKPDRCIYILDQALRIRSPSLWATADRISSPVSCFIQSSNEIAGK